MSESHILNYAAERLGQAMQRNTRESCHSFQWADFAELATTPEARQHAMLDMPAAIPLVQQVHDRIRPLHAQGIQHFVVPLIFVSAQVVQQLRLQLLPVDSESYAFLPVAADVNQQEYYQRHCPTGDAGMLVRLSAGSPTAKGQDLARQMEAILFEKIELNPPQVNWPAQAQAEIKKLHSALIRNLAPDKSNASQQNFQLEHIGSTAIPDLPAKPILDLLLGIADLHEWQNYLTVLRALDYELLQYPENTGRIFFRKGRPRTMHLHIVELGSSEWHDHIDFRDALLVDEQRARAYAELKMNLAKNFASRRAMYGKQKTNFIVSTLAEYRSRS